MTLSGGFLLFCQVVRRPQGIAQSTVRVTIIIVVRARVLMHDGDDGATS
jgi:hypothetical protein